MSRFFWSLFLRVMGWKVQGSFPYQLKKCVVIVAPHTSNWDFVIGLAMRSKLRLTHARFLGKAELFRSPFGFVFRLMGGIPVDRSEKHNMVEQVVDLFNNNESLVLAMAPEGTRKRVDKLRTGFYHIAKNAGVPIVMAGLDFGKKELVIAEAFFAGNDEGVDFRHIYGFFGRIRGKIPTQDLSHLLQSGRVL